MIANKVALVTGGSRGIGRAICLKLAEAGYTVIICSRTADPNNLEKGAYEVKNTIEAAGGSALICRADISLENERQALYDFVDKECGRLDLLVNNAGIEPKQGTALDMPPEVIEQVFDTNLKGPYFLTQHFGKRMIEWKESGAIENGCIITITSVQAGMAARSGVAYKMGKAALSMAMQCFATQLGEYGIPVFEIRPGVYPTDMCLPHAENVEKTYFPKFLMKRWGNCDEIGDLCVYMGSGKMDYATGQIIEISGGWTVPRL
ncbi:MAG: SDR family NAD(P)-dependent oxidoreductase [Ruminococcaceae bacterium]|nr:SDR family NAD(P)-dependent oxidoreductase [Oscillospiraceae bacterium]